MSYLKLRRISTSLTTLGVLSLCLLQPGHRVTGTLRLDPRAHIERGDRVEKRYQAYSERLTKHYAALVDAVKKNAPDLLVYLQPRGPILHGYQILPRIMPDVPVETHAHATPVAYSWPWTDRLIDNGWREIIHSEAELRRAAAIDSIERRAILERLAQDYEQHSRRLRNIHAHVQYNRLWQAAIAKDRAGYDRETELYTAVVERQELLDRLNRVHARFEPSRASFDSPLGLAEVSGSLRKREALLTRRIEGAMGDVQLPAFVELETLNNDWIFRVPVFTDIEDSDYVAAVKEIIEAAWRLKDGKIRYRVEIHVTYVSTDELYSEKGKPGIGQKIEVLRHLERFPSGSAILTTGARTTHVQADAIVLGPHPVAPWVLAHEFGHILGFRDRYVRGYKDLGEHGFQAMEVVADEEDIMGATAHGVVQRSHFLKLLERRVRPGSHPKAA